MENLSWVEVVLGLVALVLPVGFIYLKNYVKSTETTVDDKILAAVEKAVTDAKDAESK